MLNEQIIEDKGSCRLAAILLAQSASRQIEIFSIIRILENIDFFMFTLLFNYEREKKN